jgi:hypothetical protein
MFRITEIAAQDEEKKEDYTKIFEARGAMGRRVEQTGSGCNEQGGGFV